MDALIGNKYIVIIKTEDDRREAIKLIESWSLKKPMEVIGRVYKRNRSKSQNRLSFMWYAEIAKQSGNGKEYERNYCKWTYGCPILLEHDNVQRNFTPFYEKLINTYTYEECVASMGFVEITSLFNVSEFAEYLNHVDLYAQENNYQLTKPASLYDEAMGR